MQHFSFPDIGQFRNTIRSVIHKTRYRGVDALGEPQYDNTRPLPVIKYRGTVKLHGTNAGIAMDLNTGEVWVQSRENIITPEADNYGFAQFVALLDTKRLFGMLPVTDARGSPSAITDDGNAEVTDADLDVAVIYGEWCGGSIQKTVALNQLQKMFVVLAVKYRGLWLPEDVVKTIKLPEHRVFNIYDYPTYELEIDFEHPELVQNTLIAICTAIEDECPVGKAFGVSGVGEGTVWKPADTAQYGSSKFWFKVKGEKHSVSKVKTLAAVDVERVASIAEFVDKVVTENRLNQGLEFLKRSGFTPLEDKHVGDFIRWMSNDIIKEEADTMKASGFTWKDVNTAAIKKTRDWFFKNAPLGAP